MSRLIIITCVVFASLLLSHLGFAQEAIVPANKTSVSIRLGWLLTSGEAYLDRPVVEGSLGYNMIQPKAGRPGLAVTGSGGVAIGEAFAESTLWTFRTAVGLEPIVAVSQSVQFVLFAQVGYLTSVKDERSGLYSRVGIGFRIVTSKSFTYSFDPVSLTLLPGSNLSDLSESSDSRYGIEVGVIRAVWRF